MANRLLSNRGAVDVLPQSRPKLLGSLSIPAWHPSRGLLQGVGSEHAAWRWPHHIWTLLANLQLRSRASAPAPSAAGSLPATASASTTHGDKVLWEEANWDHILWWPSPCNWPAFPMTEEIPRAGGQPVWNSQLRLLESLANAECLVRKQSPYWGTFLQFRA